MKLILNEIDPVKELEFSRTECERFKISTGQPYLIFAKQPVTKYYGSNI